MEKLLNGLKDFFAKATADAILNAAGTLALFVLGWILIKRLLRVLDKVLCKTTLEKGVVSFINSFAAISLKALLIVMTAMSLGVPGTSFITLLGTAGIAIGLSVQGSLANLVGGLMLLIFHPFRVTHFIRVGDETGVVEDIGVFYTTVVTPERKTVVIPNGVLANSTIVNFTNSPVRRVDLPFTLAQGADIDRVTALLRREAENHPKVLADPAAEVRLDDVSGGVFTFVLRCFTMQQDWYPTKLDLTERCTRALRGEGIAFAPPQLQVTGDHQTPAK